MDKELDEKLAGIIQDIYQNGSVGDDVSKWREQIKAAFRDAGYIKPAFTTVSVAELKADPRYDPNVATGPEWYEAYKRELGFGSFDDVKAMAQGEYLKGVEVAEMKCDEAAKRASGLEKGL